MEGHGMNNGRIACCNGAVTLVECARLRQRGSVVSA